MTVINTNLSAVQARESMRSTGLKLATAMERLSSGVRINSARDDAAGLAISTRMTAEIRGIAAAVRNANDGISLTQTAEGGLGQISDSLQRIRELAVQSANSGNNASDRQAINNEANQLVAEIDRVASNSNFNGIKLLDGTFQNQPLQVGVGNNANDRITVNIASAKTASLGVGSATSYSATVTTGPGTSTPLAAGGLAINGYMVGAAPADGVSFTESNSSGIAKAAAINGVGGSTGVTATVAATSVTGTAITTATTAITAGDVMINGVDIGAIAPAPLATSAAQRGSQVAAAINAISGQTGVTAAWSAANGVTLTAADGRNITVTHATGVALSTTGLGGTGGLATAASTSTTRSIVTLTSTTASGITVAGVTAAALTATGLTNTTVPPTTGTGTGISTLDLTSISGAQAALTTLDAALNTITNQRASLGAYQNRLTASISNLETTSMNLSASRSRIVDTDYATETTNLAKAQIIQQASTAMLAQANQSAQGVMALLK